MQTISIGLHGGICYDLQSAYICACPDGSFRSQCLPKQSIEFRYLIDNYTSESFIFLLRLIVKTTTARTLRCPCENGGKCTLIGFPICTCPYGFTGTFCENSLGKKNFSIFKKKRQINDN